MHRERRWVVWIVLGGVAAIAFFMTQTGVALADNCSGVNDCLQSDSATAWVGMAAFMLFVLDIGWHLIPLTGLLDAILGYNLVTGQALSIDERVLGIVLAPLDVVPGVGMVARDVGYAITFGSVASSADDGDMYRQVAMERMVTFHLVTADGQLVHQGDDGRIQPGGPPGDLQISSGGTYGGNGTLQIQTGSARSDMITISTTGPIQQGDTVRIEIHTTGATGGGPGGV
jgi:hypothetical protein